MEGNYVKYLGSRRLHWNCSNYFLTSGNLYPLDDGRLHGINLILVVIILTDVT